MTVEKLMEVLATVHKDFEVTASCGELVCVW